MSPGARRILITLLVLVVTGGIALTVILSPKRAAQSTSSTEADQASAEVESTDGAADDGEPDDGASTDSTSGDATSDIEPPDPDAETTTSDANPDAPPAAVIDLTNLRVRTVDDAGQSDAPSTQGSLDPRDAAVEVTFTTRGAGIERIALADYWITAPTKRAAQAHYAALDAGAADVPAMPDESYRYILQTSQAYTWYANGTMRESLIPALAAHSININGTPIGLLSSSTWIETEPGSFLAVIENEVGDTVLEINRTFTSDGDGEISLTQRVSNRSGQSLDVQWIQYGPGDLPIDRSRYLDRRRFRFGPQIVTGTDPVTYDVLPKENDLLFERQSKVKDIRKSSNPAESKLLWPNEDAVEAGYDLAWFASTNRYFAFAIHKYADDELTLTSDKSIDDVIQSVYIDASATQSQDDEPTLFTLLYSTTRTVAPDAETSFNLGVYAGPLDPQILGERQPFKSLRLEGLILYQMSSFCAICTFQWLAHLLLAFLGFLHGITGDYGLAIIGLVLVVRAILHPLVKKSQINMQRFSRGMAKLKPEIEKLQKKFAGDAKRIQQEQMRLMREHNINPLQMLGCLPMFLQTPIWIALYAGLYFAIELRQEAAFYGVFQMIGGWPFLSDLSSADHFFYEYETPRSILFWNITGINLLPLLMGVVMYVSQKYMSPPPSAAMTEDQARQQKMMRIIFPLILPLAMYSAPSGLTLYIMTSTTIGILESRYIRKHVDELDKRDEDPDQYVRKKKKINMKDPHARAYAAAVERAREKRDKKRKKNYKKKR